MNIKAGWSISPFAKYLDSECVKAKFENIFQLFHRFQYVFLDLICKACLKRISETNVLDNYER